MFNCDTSKENILGFLHIDDSQSICNFFTFIAWKFVTYLFCRYQTERSVPSHLDLDLMDWDVTEFHNRMTKSYDYFSLFLLCSYILPYSTLSSLPPCEIPQTLTRSHQCWRLFLTMSHHSKSPSENRWHTITWRTTRITSHGTPSKQSHERVSTTVVAYECY